jgi:uncharacterized protein YdaU (DUF1376 family)
MPFYIGDYLADTMHLSDAEHGAYVLLIFHYWRTGPLRDDDKNLAAIARCPMKRWLASTAAAIRPFFHSDGGLLIHKRVEEELRKAGGISSKRKAAAMQRWSKQPCKTDANAFHMDTHAGARPSASQSQSQLPEERKSTPINPPAEKAPRGSRLTEEWTPRRAEIEKARELKVDVEAAAEECRNYWLAQSGQRAVRANWDLTFRNRLTELAEKGRFPIKAISLFDRPLNGKTYDPRYFEPNTIEAVQTLPRPKSGTWEAQAWDAAQNGFPTNPPPGSHPRTP